MSFQATKWAIQHRGLPPIAQHVLMLLAAHADDRGQCWPSQATLCEISGLSERSVRNGISALEKAGLVTREKRRRADGSRLSDLLTLNLNRHVVPVDTNRQEVPAQPASGAATTGTTCRDPRQEVPVKSQVNNQEEENYATGREDGPIKGYQGELDDLEKALRDAAGEALRHDSWQLADLSAVKGWIERGISLEKDILPTIAARCKNLPRHRVGTWHYFSGPVAEAHARRTTPTIVPLHPLETSAPRERRSKQDTITAAFAEIRRQIG